MWNPKPGNHSEEPQCIYSEKWPRTLDIAVTRYIKGGRIIACCKKLQLGRLADGESGRNGSRVPWYFTITPLFGTIAPWGCGINIHRSEQEMNLVGEKLWNKWNNQTRRASVVGLSLCTVTNAHHHCLELFLSYEELSFFFFLSKKTKHAAYLMYAVRVTLEGEETDELKMPALLTLRAPAGHDWKRIHMTTSSTAPVSFLFFFLSIPSL